MDYFLIVNVVKSRAYFYHPLESLRYVFSISRSSWDQCLVRFEVVLQVSFAQLHYQNCLYIVVFIDNCSAIKLDKMGVVEFTDEKSYGKQAKISS